MARTTIKTHEGDGKWPLLVNKQLSRWSESITLDNNNDVLTYLTYSFLSCLYHWLAWPGFPAGGYKAEGGN